MKITNSAAGPRGVNLHDGTTVWLEPGESRTFDKGDVKAVHADLEQHAPALSGLTKAELLDLATAESVAVAEDATKAEIIAAIEAHRAGA